MGASSSVVHRSSQAADTGRDKGAGRVVHANQWHALLAAHVEHAGQLVAVGRVDGTGADREVMAVDADIAAVDIEDPGHQRGAIEVLAPVLEKHVRLFLGQHLDPLPDRHAFLEMLLFNLADGNRFDRALDQVVTFLHDIFVAAADPGNFAGNGELDLFRWSKWILQ